MVKAMRRRGQADKERGASLVEYALLVSLICIVAIVSVRAVGTTIRRGLVETADQLGAAGGQE